MKRNKLEIHAGTKHAMVGDGKVILNDIELNGVRDIWFRVLPDEILSAVVTIRVDDIYLDGAMTALDGVPHAKV